MSELLESLVILQILFLENKIFQSKTFRILEDYCSDCCTVMRVIVKTIRMFILYLMQKVTHVPLISADFEAFNKTTK